MNKTIFYLSQLFLFLLTSIAAQSQSKIAGELKVDYVPFSNYVRPMDSTKTSAESNFKRAQIAFEIPLSLEMDQYHRPKLWSLFANGSYAKMENKNYEIQSLPLEFQGGFPNEMLNAQIGVKHLRSISPTWSLMIMASVGVYTDMVEINKDDVLLQGGVFFIKHFNPNMAFGMGPVLTNSFGVPMVLPGIYFNWESRGAWHFKITFPESLQFGYRISENFDLKAVVELSGMTAETKVNNRTSLLGYQQIIAGIQPEIKLGKHWTLQPTAGSTLLRSFSSTNRKIKDIFKEKDMANPRFTTTFYGAVALKWQF
ncbi:DUF6268 family outer membrane beta-barrel protein [Flavobacterium tructae]|uniref:DUF6268 family outer membrane beta-barrel protein n=1 Tax=Flavobacterium TaxID=237 RepID=UPI00201EBDC8|nr:MULTISPECIES: DUF6268 family outer membrane beta-barrel protein [Flavobacterium]MDL2143098.1 DUF6268 family outer membrane beta-barrel protein [Flavobacterium tructae]URC12789.1 DUF6268 family outer membrane beta-barrel protein [Flavobacterium sp. B183]